VEELQEIMGFAALEKRIRALEQFFSATGKECNCRSGGQTTYHNAKELENLMEIRCPAHGFRDLGCLRWLPNGLPLQPDDQNVCSCPPCPVREFLQGRRGPLTEVEQETLEKRWQQKFGVSSDEEFRREQARVEQVASEIRVRQTQQQEKRWLKYRVRGKQK
jgi:hypothetical protein